MPKCHASNPPETDRGTFRYVGAGAVYHSAWSRTERRVQCPPAGSHSLVIVIVTEATPEHTTRILPAHDADSGWQTRSRQVRGK